MRGHSPSIARRPLAGLAIFGVISTAMTGIAPAQTSVDQIIAALKPTGNLAAGATRGIKLGGAPSARDIVATKPAATGAPAPRPAASTAQTPDGAPSVNLTVNFPTGSAELTTAARASLDSLGKALASNDLATFRFRIEGHTDNVGARNENRRLSQRRAEAVVVYLASQHGVNASRLEAVGMGQEHLLVETPPQTPEARNRRVQVINLGA